jgi:ribosomal protein L7/L12
LNGETPNGVRPLDVGPIRMDLESFLRELAAGRAVDDDAVLQRARLMLVRLRGRPAAGGTASEGTPEGSAELAGAGGWQAVAVDGGNDAGEVSCWKGAAPDAILHGQWRGSELELVYVAAGERFWSTRHTPDGESRASTDPTSAAAADRKRFADLGRRAREEMASWNEATAVPRRVCGRCSWESDDAAPRCPVCGTPRPGTGGGAAGGVNGSVGDPGAATSGRWPVESDPAIPDDPEPGELPRGKPSEVLEEPENLSNALGDLLRDVVEDVARDAAGELRERVRRGDPSETAAELRSGGTDPPGAPKAAGTGFDVVLTAFDPARKIACIQAVKDAREWCGETPAGLAAAKGIVESAPGVVCRAVSAPGAEEIRGALERVGGRVEIRRSGG